MISYHMHSIAPSYEGSTEVKLYGSTKVLSYFRTLYESTKVIPISLLIILRMKYFLKVRKYESTKVLSYESSTRTRTATFVLPS